MVISVPEPVSVPHSHSHSDNAPVAAGGEYGQLALHAAEPHSSNSGYGAVSFNTHTPYQQLSVASSESSYHAAPVLPDSSYQAVPQAYQSLNDADVAGNELTSART